MIFLKLSNVRLLLTENEFYLRAILIKSLQKLKS